MDALTALLEAVETILENMRYPERMNPSDPVCHVHPDALVALEEAYDRMMDGAEDAPENDELLAIIEDEDEMT